MQPQSVKGKCHAVTAVTGKSDVMSEVERERASRSRGSCQGKREAVQLSCPAFQNLKNTVPEYGCWPDVERRRSYSYNTQCLPSTTVRHTMTTRLLLHALLLSEVVQVKLVIGRPRKKLPGLPFLLVLLDFLYLCICWLVTHALLRNQRCPTWYRARSASFDEPPYDLSVTPCFGACALSCHIVNKTHLTECVCCD